MGYRSSFLLRISSTVLIAFAWLAFLFLYLALWAGPDVNADLAVLLVTGIIDAAAIGLLWLRWYVQR